MATGNVFGINNSRVNTSDTLTLFSRIFSTLARQLARVWCGMHGHLIMLHYEPNKLSLQCSLCGYETEGWEVGRSMTARRQANNPQARPERRRTMRPLPTKARLAS